MEWLIRVYMKVDGKEYRLCDAFLHNESIEERKKEYPCPQCKLISFEVGRSLIHICDCGFTILVKERV